MQAVRQPNLAVVGFHGLPEITGLLLKESTDAAPIAGWDVVTGNELAVEKGVRYVKRDPSWGFPGEPHSLDYESRRPSEILELSSGRRRILEVHDRPDETGEYAVVGGAWRHDLLSIVGALGIRSVIIDGRLPTLAQYRSSVVVDLCRADGTPGSSACIADNVRRLRRCMESAAAGTLPQVSTTEFTFYDFVRDVPASVAFSLGLEDGVLVGPFEPLPRRAVQLLGLPHDVAYVVQCWNGINSSGGKCFGTILKETTVPPPLAEQPTGRAWCDDIRISAKI